MAHTERLDDGGKAGAALHRVSKPYPTRETHKQQNERQQQVYAFCSGCTRERLCDGGKAAAEQALWRDFPHINAC